jgi:hypothetical protein
LAEVANEWCSHVFYALFNIARGVSLEGGGRFTTPTPYANPAMTGVDGFGVDILIFTRVIIWLFLAFGVALIVWGLRENKS